MKFLSNRGFSLASVMVAAGLLGGLSLAVMQVMKNINDGQSRAGSVADEAEMTVVIRMILDNPNYCKMSLAGMTFKKEDVDFGGVEVERSSNFTSASEGLDVELWYSNIAGNTRTIKKFNGDDNISGSDKSKFGKLKIKSMKLVMFNGPTACPDNYCSTDTNDIGQLVVLYEKKINSSQSRPAIKTFPLNLGFTTDGSGVSTIQFCSATPSLISVPVFPPVNCGWTPTVTAAKPSWATATCPLGKSLRGYSFLTSNNEKENMEVEVLPDRIRGRRVNDGTNITVKAYCCDP